jgi:Holliday junction resolvase
LTKKINSRAKGATGEREIANYFTANGFPARRGQQFSGSSDSPDIVCDSLSGYHFEIKRVDRGVNIYDWMAQAIKDAGSEKTPVVIHRKSREDWVVIMRIDDFLELVHP